MTSFSFLQDPYVRAALHAGLLLLALWSLPDKLKANWHLLDSFDDSSGSRAKRALANFGAVLRLYGALMSAFLGGILGLYGISTAPSTPKELVTAIYFGGLVYGGMLCWTFFRNSSRAAIARLDADRKSCSCVRNSQAAAAGKATGNLLPSKEESLASAVLERERTLGKLVDMEATGKVPSPFLQGLLSKHPDPLVLALQNLTHQQPAGKSIEKDANP